MAQTKTYAPGDKYVTRGGGARTLTKFHIYKERLVVCPVCDCGPCVPACSEQALPAPGHVEAS